jgi:WD40 repeat protein
LVEKCPHCNQPDLLFSKKRQIYICEDCGHEFIPKESFTPQRIFISYGHDEHISLAIQLRDDLRERGHEVWFDEERLLPSADWEVRIEEGLKWTAENKPHAAVILLLTPHSVRRPEGFCLNEVARALMLNLRIIPLMVVESEPPLSICRIQWLDMRECIPIHEKKALYEPRFQRLLEALEKEELDYEGLQSRLLRTLQPIEFSADLFKLLRDFTGRKWVFAEIDAWLNDPTGVKLFWLTGAPGVGKSSLAAWVREHRREVAAYHFCDINSEEKRNPAKLVCSIVYQLSTQLPEYQERLGRLDLEGIVQEYHEAYTLFDKLMVQPLCEGYPVPDRTIVVLIDALDEATSRRQNEIVRLLSRSADKTPPWLRFLVTSRPEPEITSSFQALNPYILDTARYENLADLREFITTMIPEITPVQTTELLKRSEGVFLYLAHVVAGIKDKTLDLEQIEAFPRGLGDVYQQFFDRQFGSDLAYYEEKIVPLLQPILAAYEPLTLKQLKNICGIAEATDLERCLNRFGSLFPTSGDDDLVTIRPFHRSLSDWIGDRKSSGHFVIADTDGHHVLAEHCWQEYRAGVKTISSYTLRFLPAHLLAAKRFDDLIGDEENPGPLTDLCFIQAKCEAGLVSDLVSDYNLVLKELPEFREEQEYQRKYDEAMRAYNKALNYYAVKRYDYLKMRENGEACSEPPYPEMPTILSDGKRPSLAEESSVRAARLRHFVNFVFSHTWSLQQYPDRAAQLAYNSAEEGPLNEAGLRIIETLSIPLLLRSPRPPLSPFRQLCLRTLEGHSKGVLSVSVTTDGKRAVSGSYDSTVRLWDLETGECLRTLKGHVDRYMVASVSVTPDGKRVVSGSWDETLRLWDMGTGECLRTLEGYRGWVLSVSVTPDGKRAVSGSHDKIVCLWDLETGECLRTLKGHSESVTSVSVTPDGKRAVSGSHDKNVRLWDLETGECLRTLKGHGESVTSVSVTPDGKRVVSGSWDHTLRLWNLETGECLRTLKGHSRLVACVSLTPDGKRAVSGSNDNTVRLWNLETGECLRTLEGHSDGVKSVSVTPGGRRVVSGSNDNTVRLWDLETGACQRKLEGHSDGGVSSISLALDSRWVVSGGSRDNSVHLWDLETGECQRKLEGHSEGVESVSVTPDGKRVVSGSWDKTLRLWDMGTGECLRTLEGHSGGVLIVSVTPDGKRAVSGSCDNTFRLWDLETGECLRTLEGHSDLVVSVNVCPDGKQAVSGSWDATLRLWDMETGECLRTLKGHSGLVASVRVSPDGRWVVSGSHDNTVRLWDLETGECLRKLEGHGGWVDSVSVSPDGKQAVSGSWDKTLRLWDLETGECLAVYSARAQITSTNVSPITNLIICGTGDGQMHFLKPVNIKLSGLGFTTAVRLWLFGDGKAPGRWDDNLTALCPWCGKQFTVDKEMIDTQTTCLFNDCTREIIINPFVVDNKSFQSP